MAATPAAVPSVAHVLVADINYPTLSASDHHHVVKVLRARKGEAITATDGAGAWQLGSIPSDWTDPSMPIVCETDVQHVPARRPLCVAFSLVKADKPETVVQKLTEIGIDRIVLLSAQHSVVKWDADRAVKHLVRLQSVAREALMQSRSVWLPVVHGPFSPVDFAQQEMAEGRSVVVADFGGDPITDSMIDHNWVIDTVLIGPEGGWSPAERDVFARVSRFVSFGDQIFRSETAAIAAGVVLNASRHHHNR
jgi:16S rRNA (uracil1498-N3)-methyltransferase